jgi:hypothetical protein
MRLMDRADDSMFTTIPVECYSGARGEETPAGHLRSQAWSVASESHQGPGA